jgi:cell division protein FtsL
MRSNKRRSPKQAPWSLPKKRLRFRRTPSSSPSVRKPFFRNGGVSGRIEPSSSLYMVAMCLVVAVVAAAFVFHLNVRFEGVRLGYDTSQARAIRSRLIVERRELRLELATLKAPERVEAEARERLSMEVPDYRRIVVIGKRKSEIVASGGAR